MSDSDKRYEVRIRREQKLGEMSSNNTIYYSERGPALEKARQLEEENPKLSVSVLERDPYGKMNGFLSYFAVIWVAGPPRGHDEARTAARVVRRTVIDAKAG